MFGLDLTLILAGVAAFFGLISKLLWDKNKKTEKRAERAEKAVRRKQLVRDSDEEIDLDFAEIERQAEEDMRNGQIPKHVRDPNDF